MARRKTEVSTSDWTLTAEQETAADMLASGQTVADVAEAVNVSVQTVREWYRQPWIRATINSRREEMWEAPGFRMRSLLPKALKVLEAELEGEKRLEAAIHVVKSCGLYGKQLYIGQTEAVDAYIAAEEKKEKLQFRALAAGVSTNHF